MGDIIKTFLLAMTPVGEIRIALPIAITIYKLNWFLAYIVSIIGNIFPIIFILLFLEPVSKWLSNNSKIFKRFFDWLFERTRRKSTKQMERYGYMALVIFIAIPLPLTGAWTGAVVAFLFGISFRRALPLIALGVALAGLIVLVLTKIGIWVI
jgi:uncharacterized membrane protein